MENFAMSCFKIPQSILKKIDSSQCHFLSGHKQTDIRRLCLKKWKDICTSLECGGLVSES